VTNDLDALQTALALRRRELIPNPLYPVGATMPTKRGPKTAKGKEPIGARWGRDALVRSEDDLRGMFRRHPGAGVPGARAKGAETQRRL
jgi:hypothetical protein